MSSDDLWSQGFSKLTRMDPEATLYDYWSAPGGEVETAGLSHQWQDKPHRLLYDLIGEILHLRASLSEAEELLRAEAARPKRTLEDSWRGQVDRSGGAFTEEEIRRATEWR
jgi:hypothetical protein